MELIPDNTSLFLSGGSTLALVADGLKWRRGLTVVTNNLPAAILLLENRSFEVHIVGGLARAASGSTTGKRAVEFIERFKVDTAVISTSGIDSDGTLFSYDHSLVLASKAMISNSRRRILVADATKFDGGGVVRVLHLRDFDLLVTNGKLSRDAEALIADSSVEILLADANKRGE